MLKIIYEAYKNIFEEVPVKAISATRIIVSVTKFLLKIHANLCRFMLMFMLKDIKVIFTSFNTKICFCNLKNKFW